MATKYGYQIVRGTEPGTYRVVPPASGGLAWYVAVVHDASPPDPPDGDVTRQELVAWWDRLAGLRPGVAAAVQCLLPPEDAE